VGKSRARYKVVLLGEAQVGKTSLLSRYITGAFDEQYRATLGTTMSKHVEVVMLEGGRTVEVGLIIWDIEGSQGIMDLLRESYFRGAKGALAVFDVTRRETLEALDYWVETARQEAPGMPILVLGNKSDLEERRVVSDGEAQDYCRSLGCPYFPTSAKNGQNVQAAFAHLSREVLRTYSAAVAHQ
jgi:small GTP-binding protein